MNTKKQLIIDLSIAYLIMFIVASISTDNKIFNYNIFQIMLLMSLITIISAISTLFNSPFSYFFLKLKIAFILFLIGGLFQATLFHKPSPVFERKVYEEYEGKNNRCIWNIIYYYKDKLTGEKEFKRTIMIGTKKSMENRMSEMISNWDKSHPDKEFLNYEEKLEDYSADDIHKKIMSL